MVTHGPSSASASLHEVGERMRRVDPRVAVVGRESAVDVERAIGVFGRADARGRGAEDDRDARRAVALARGMDGVDEAVGLQAEPGQPVVAAIPGGERLGQRRRFEPGDAADPGRQRRRPEIVRRQARCGPRAARRAEQPCRDRPRWSRCRRRFEAERSVRHGGLRQLGPRLSVDDLRDDDAAEDDDHRRRRDQRRARAEAVQQTARRPAARGPGR